MTIYVLLREDQNEHGYIDVTVGGIFRTEADASRRLERARNEARQQGMRCEDDEDSDADWQVSWKIEDHDVE